MDFQKKDFLQKYILLTISPPTNSRRCDSKRVAWLQRGRFINASERASNAAEGSKVNEKDAKLGLKSLFSCTII